MSFRAAVDTRPSVSTSATSAMASNTPGSSRSLYNSMSAIPTL